MHGQLIKAILPQKINDIYHTAEKETKQMNMELNKLKQYLGMVQHDRPFEKDKNEQLR